MNKILRGTQIEALNEQHSIMIMETYQKYGFDTFCIRLATNKRISDFDYAKRFYGVSRDGKFIKGRFRERHQTITIDEAHAIMEDAVRKFAIDYESGYPKLMVVWNDSSDYIHDDPFEPYFEKYMVVFKKMNDKYLAWHPRSMETPIYRRPIFEYIHAENADYRH